MNYKMCFLKINKVLELIIDGKKEFLEKLCFVLKKGKLEIFLELYNSCLTGIKSKRYWGCWFFKSNTFISNTRVKLAKNEAKATQHPKGELSLFEKYSLSSSTLSTKNNRRHYKKYTKNNWVCFSGVIWFYVMTLKMRLKIKNVQKTVGSALMMLYDYVMTLKSRLKIKNRSQRYNTN